MSGKNDIIVEAHKPHRRTCGTMEVHKRLLETDPAYRKNRYKIERFTQFYVKYNARSGLRSGIVRIPVVVHVVYNTSAQNISDVQIQSQIDVLNQDYRMLNSDTSLVPSVFQPLAADARIEFQLAVRDPNCNPTNGITRTSTTVTSFSTDNSVKSAATGGADPWPSNKYLNIWVCRLSSGLLGYAQFPGGSATTDGVVITDTAFGNTGTVLAPYNKGRTATHEIGHWLNLLHIWGDDGGACTGSDMVDDTPNQASENYGCPVFPHVSCSNGPNGDMFMNYMDYTDDPCMFMFTAGQSARIDATLYGPRSSIVASDGLVPPPMPSVPDLWSQDTPEDIGAEPNISSSVMYESDDIWVRKQNDGFVNQEHQNPEYREPGFGSNFVYVRIRNRGCGGSTSGTVKLYWAKASTALGWPTPWDGSITTPALMGGLIGTQPTGSVTGGDFVILEFPWYPPNPADYSSFGADQSHFCLLSRIETSLTPPYGMTFPEGSDLYTNVKNNNNIVWKNITVVDEFPGSGKMSWITIGSYGKRSNTKLVFSVIVKKGQRSIFDWGTIIVDLGETLFKKWKEGGSVGAGIKILDGNQISLSKSGDWIGNIMLLEKELFTISLHFKPSKQVERNNVFFLDLTQYAVEEKSVTVVGGQRFVLKTIAAYEPEKGITKIFDGATWVQMPIRAIG